MHRITSSDYSGKMEQLHYVVVFERIRHGLQSVQEWKTFINNNQWNIYQEMHKLTVRPTILLCKFINEWMSCPVSRESKNRAANVAP